MNCTYDIIRCESYQWGNELMARLAACHFEQHPESRFVLVYEHAGWHLGFRRDISIWCTANDAAVLRVSKPQPGDYSGCSFSYPHISDCGESAQSGR